MSTQLFFEDIEQGQEVGPLLKGPLTSMHLMRWSAAIENWHRIHYDAPFATGHDGLPDVVVAGSWKQHVLAQLFKDWAGRGGWLRSLRFQYRGTDACGATLGARGRVIGLERRTGFGLVRCSVELSDAGNASNTLGEAVVMLPLRGGDTVPEPLQPTEDAVPCAVARSPLSPAASRLLGPHQTSQVGKWSERQYAPEPVERGAIRRFAQAIMDPDPWYADDAAAQAGRFGQIVAPPLFPLHALRRAAGTPDPLSAAVADPHFDGFGQLSTILGLESLDLPLKRFLNGGSDHTMFSLARMGERISVLSRYEDLYVKDGKDGPLVFAVIHSRFEAEAPAAAGRRPLLSTRQTYVWR